MPRKPKKEPDSEPEETFTVEVITRARVEADGNSWAYYVKWYNYDESENSWEPEENLGGCNRLLASFWDHVGHDNEDYPAGFHIDAKPDWIKKESKYCRKQMAKEESQKKLRKEKAQEKKRKVKTESRESSQLPQTSSKNRGKGKAVVVSDSEEEEVPLRLKTSRSKATRPLAVIDVGSSDGEHQTSVSVKRKASVESSAAETNPPKKKIKLKTPVVKTVSKPKLPEVEDDHGSLFSGSSSDESDVPLSRNVSGSKAKPSPSAITQLAQTKNKVAPTTRGTVPSSLFGSSASTSSAAPIVPRGANSSKLSTKSRLGVSALELHNPKDGSKKPKFGGLKIKKRASADASSKELPSPMLPPTPTSFASGRKFVSEDHTDYSFPDSSAVDRVASPEIQSLDVDQFLDTVMPLEREQRHDVPVQNTSETISTPTTEGAESGLTKKAGKKMASLPRIQKRWRWEGKLLRRTESGSSILLCNGHLSDPTEHPPLGVSIEILMAKSDVLEFGKFRPVYDLNLLLPAFKPAQQFALLHPQGNEDRTTLSMWSKYMVKKSLFVLSPLYLEEEIDPVAFFVIFPSTMDDFRLKVGAPLKWGVENVFIVALFPWMIEPGFAREWRSDIERDPDQTRSTDTDPSQSHWVRCRPNSRRALRILRFPGPETAIVKALLRGREIFVWDNAEGRNKFETTLLRHIFRRFDKSTVQNKLKSPRWIFVHASAIRSLSRLKGFKDLRATRPEVQFFIYGTDSSISPEHWGVREIFPSGGIVTFTPNALALNQTRCLQKILQSVEHPLWDCYLLPNVAAYLAIHLALGNDPLEATDEEYLLCRLLDLVEAKSITIAHVPPNFTSPSCSDDALRQWQYDQLMALSLPRRRIMERCLKVFQQQFSEIPKTQWLSILNTEVRNDISLQQQQPHVMDAYRRFVVIAAADEIASLQDDHSVEVMEVDQMSFPDFARKPDFLARFKSLSVNDE